MSDEGLKILADDIVDFLNGIEASCVKLRMQIKKLLEPSTTKAKTIIPEDTFNILKWQDEEGKRLGDYQVAYKSQNLPDKWNHAFNVLRANTALISDPFHEEGYEFRYWIYPEKYDNRIFRKKLKEKEA